MESEGTRVRGEGGEKDSWKVFLVFGENMKTDNGITFSFLDEGGRYF